MTPKNECEILLDALLPFGEEQLKKYREFYPYAAVMCMDGSVELTASYDGNEHPESKTVLEDLRKIHRQLAAEGSIKASGIAWNATVASADGKPSDAIVVSLEHMDAYSVIVCEPYKLGLFKKVKLGELFAMPGRNDVFDAAEAQTAPGDMQKYRDQLQKTVITPMMEYLQGCKTCGYSEQDVAKCQELILAYLDALEGIHAPANREIMEQVRVLVLALNELNEKTDFCLLETDEREAICEIIQSSAVACGLTDAEDDVTEEWREW